MSVTFTPNQINELRYLNDKKGIYANLEYSRLTHIIEINYFDKNQKLIFTAKENKDEMEEFWMNLVENSLNKKLKSLDEVIKEMKENFEIKNL